jgi:hypothetical protein
VDIESAALTPAAVHSLMQPAFVRSVRPISRTEVRVHVEEAGTAIPELLEIMNGINCDVQTIEEYRPSFDEVFVELMNRDTEARRLAGEDEEAD